MLTYENAVEAMDWLCRVFRCTEKTKWLDSEGKLIQNCRQAAKWYAVPYIINGVFVCVDDIQKHYESAREMCAEILS